MVVTRGLQVSDARGVALTIGSGWISSKLSARGAAINTGFAPFGFARTHAGNTDFPCIAGVDVLCVLLGATYID